MSQNQATTVDFGRGATDAVWAEVDQLRTANANLIAELSAAVGYMRNAKIDLETGATKATAIRTIEGGIKRAEEALAKAEVR